MRLYSTYLGKRSGNSSEWFLNKTARKGSWGARSSFKSSTGLRYEASSSMSLTEGKGRGTIVKRVAGKKGKYRSR